MSKLYTIRSADGQRSYGSVTKVAAKGMVRRGEAKFLPNCSVVQLTPPENIPENKRQPTGKDFRGLSAAPGAPLMHRYVKAETGDTDPLAVAAIHGWKPRAQFAPIRREARR
jgi:hypothetical protein